MSGNKYYGVKPLPPAKHIRHAGHHWLEVLDYDGHSFGMIVLQWSPVAQIWTRSNEIATGWEYNASGYRYVAEAPLPPVGA